MLDSAKTGLDIAHGRRSFLPFVPMLKALDQSYSLEADMRLFLRPCNLPMTALDLPSLPLLYNPDPLELSCRLLHLLGVQLTVTGHPPVSGQVPLLVVSNHRSPLDALVLMAALHRNIAFAYHPYMLRVPFLKEVVEGFGAFPLENPRQFLRQGRQRLQRQEAIGVFPEGAKPMVTLQSPRRMDSFHRGFAHLALGSCLPHIALLPVALVSDETGFESPIPLRLLGWFAPQEPLFHQAGGHPVVMYRQVTVRVGAPIWVQSSDHPTRRERTRAAADLSDRCWQTIHSLLQAP